MVCTVTTKDEWLKLSDACEPVADYFECNGVLFSATRKGDGLRIHVACHKDNILNLRSGCLEFIENMLSTFEWCNMLIATVSHENKTVINLCMKLGFTDLGDYLFDGGMGKLMVIKR